MPKKSVSKSIQSKGGLARAEKLTTKQRSEIAKKAAAARWSAPIAEWAGVLELGETKIPCYVLQDGRRVLSHRGLQTSMTMAISGGAKKTSQFFGKIEAKLPVGKDLAARLNSPVEFIPKASGRTAYGYEADILADICDVMLEARKLEFPLTATEARIADQCEILLRGFGRVGIAALVDEATGYQHVRARDALAKILEAFIKDEAGKWAKRFPNAFYEELFRLKGKVWPPASGHRMPSHVGHWTNNVVYKRLAPGVLDDLRTKTPRLPSGNRKHKFHQWLTDDIGHPKLQEHIQAVLALMRASDTWEEFETMLNRSLPKQPQSATDRAQKKLAFSD